MPTYLLTFTAAGQPDQPQQLRCEAADAMEAIGQAQQLNPGCIIAEARVDAPIFVLQIEHRHDTTFSAHTTRQGALQERDAYAEEYWPQEHQTRNLPMPKAGIANQYFDLVEGEYSGIYEVRLEGLAPAVARQEDDILRKPEDSARPCSECGGADHCADDHYDMVGSPSPPPSMAPWAALLLYLERFLQEKPLTLESKEGRSVQILRDPLTGQYRVRDKISWDEESPGTCADATGALDRALHLLGHPEQRIGARSAPDAAPRSR